MIGMAMSMRITSGSTESASCTASDPSPAWPTTSSRSSVARIASRAWPNRRWSSAISTRIPSGTLTAASMTRVHYQCELLRSICEGETMIDLSRIDAQTLSTEPYRWAFIGELFSPSDAAALVESYPEDGFKTLIGSDGEKGWEYEARSLIHMGASTPSHPENLSREWQQLADDLVSPGYREAMGRLTGLELTASPIEVNVFHYGPGAWMGPHKDLA